MRFFSRKSWVLFVFCSQVILSIPSASQAAASTIVTGEVEVRIADDFARKRSWEIVLLHDSSTGKVYTLSFPENRPSGLRSGDRVMVTGNLTGHALAVESSFLISPPRPLRETASRKASVVAGGLRSVVLIVNLADASVTCTPSQIASIMYTGASSVNGLFQEMSFGLVSFPSDTNQDSQPDVFGPFTIAGSKSVCDPDGWANAADAAAQTAGVNLALYGFKMYVLPSDVTCPWAGLGYLGDENQITPTSCFGTSQCRSWNVVCSAGSVYAHELGHNVGMLHASKDEDNDGYVDPGWEYGDFSDVMGCCGLHHVNGPHKIEMGWLPPGKVIEVSASGVYSLAPLETDPASTALPQVLKIRDLYYLSYRQPTGYDSTLFDPYTNTTNVHRQKTLFEYSPDPPFDLLAGRFLGNTLRITGIADNMGFLDPVNGVTILQISHSTTQATVEVTLGRPAGLDFHTIEPCRWLDTRTTFGLGFPLFSGTETLFRLAGRCGIPASARALSVNVTVTGPTGAGHVVFYPSNKVGTDTSVINFAAGQTRANNAILPLSADGYQALGVVPVLSNNGQLHIIVDVNGYFE